LHVFIGLIEKSCDLDETILLLGDFVLNIYFVGYIR